MKTRLFFSLCLSAFALQLAAQDASVVEKNRALLNAIRRQRLVIASPVTNAPKKKMLASPRTATSTLMMAAVADAVDTTSSVSTSSGIGVFETSGAFGNGSVGAHVIQYTNAGYTGGYSAGLTVADYVPNYGGTNISTGGWGSWGIDCYKFINHGGVALPGAAAAIQGAMLGDQGGPNAGISGFGISFTPEVQLMGVVGIGGAYGKGARAVGVYAGYDEIADLAFDVKLTPAALLADAGSGNVPVFIGRSHGEEKIRVENDGTLALLKAPAGSAPCRLKLGLATDAAGRPRLALEINGQNFFVNLTTE